jgi:tol-pal system protein YbgF
MLSASLATGVVLAEPTIQDEMSVLSKRVQAVEESVNNTATKQALISLQMKMKAMEKELQNLRNQNESLRNDLNQVKQKQRENFIAIDQRLQSQSAVTAGQEVLVSETEAEIVDTGAAAGAAAENQSQAQQGTPVITATEDSSETTDAYRDAFLLLKQRRYDESITAFETFLQKYPNSKYAANSQYWLSEANYVTKRYDIALVEFQKVIDQYPTSSKVPDARLKIGYTQYELGSYDEARAALTQLRAQYPNSTVAGLAQQRLERMEREGH